MINLLAAKRLANISLLIYGCLRMGETKSLKKQKLSPQMAKRSNLLGIAATMFETGNNKL